MSAVAELGFKVSHLLDLTCYEGEGHFLEGTGSLVLDHVQRVAYACLSAAHPRGPGAASGRCELDYEVVSFSAAEPPGRPAVPHQRVPVDRRARGGRRQRGDRTADRDRVLWTDSGRAAGRLSSRSATMRSSTSPATCSSSAPGTRRSGIARARDVGVGAPCAHPGAVRAALRLHRHRACGPDPHHRDAGRRQRALHAGGGVPHHP